MDILIIFGAKYLYLLSLALLALLIIKSSPERRREILVFTLLSFALAYMLAVGARALYDNPRPFVVGGYEPLVPHEADNGFPSDHVLLVSAVASLFIVHGRKWALWLWLIALGVAVSRVYAGVHHSIDVLASMVIALLSALVVHLFLRWRNNDTMPLSNH